jgi:hypothetical protein
MNENEWNGTGVGMTGIVLFRKHWTNKCTKASRENYKRAELGISNL